MGGKAFVVLAQKELRDAFRNRWFIADALALLILSLALSLLVSLTGAASPVSGFGRTAASLVNLMLLLVPLMGITLGALAIAGDRERGALEFWLTQPVSTATFFLAKALGMGAALAAAVLVGFGASSVVLLLVGATDPFAFLALAGLTVLLAWASLALGLLLSSHCARTSTAVSLDLGAWLLLVLLGDLGLMGTALAVRLPQLGSWPSRWATRWRPIVSPHCACSLAPWSCSDRPGSMLTSASGPVSGSCCQRRSFSGSPQAAVSRTSFCAGRCRDDPSAVSHGALGKPLGRSMLASESAHPTGDPPRARSLQRVRDDHLRAAFCGCCRDGERRYDALRRHRLPARVSTEAFPRMGSHLGA